MNDELNFEAKLFANRSFKRVNILCFFHLLQKLHENLHSFIMASGLKSHDSSIAISYKQ